MSKEALTIEEAAEGLAYLALAPLRDPSRVSRLLDACRDKERASTELLFLSAFAVDFATQLVVGPSEELQALVSEYAAHLKKCLTPDGWLALQQRLACYAEPARAMGASGPDGMRKVGEAFAELCGHEPWDWDVVVPATVFLAATIEGVTEYLGAIEIED